MSVALEEWRRCTVPHSLCFRSASGVPHLGESPWPRVGDWSAWRWIASAHT